MQDVIGPAVTEVEAAHQAGDELRQVILAIPIGIMSGIYMSEYFGSRPASAVRFAADTLNGVPSIVIGVFVFGIAVLPFKQFTMIAGGVALGIMMIPIIARTTEELLKLVPHSLREGAFDNRGRDVALCSRARDVFGVPAMTTPSLSMLFVEDTE